MSSKFTIFPYNIAEDTARFQPSVIDSEKGYYDTIEKKFITSSTLDSLMDILIPQKNYFEKRDQRINQSINRIRRNLSVYQKNPGDSYAQVLLKYLSSRFLVSQSQNMVDAAVLIVDIVESTKLATKLSPEELSSLVRVFSQEMSILISAHAGFVLKYSGDAVIAYFPQLEQSGNKEENAIICGKSMHAIIEHALNSAGPDFAIPKIQIRVSIDCGKDRIVFLGTEPDLIGHTITISSKMIRFAKPGQMVIGENTYTNIPAELQQGFVKSDDTNWNYTDPETGKIYPIYISKTGEP